MVNHSPLPRQKASPRASAQATAHLAQTMALLGLNNNELLEAIEGELGKNPALELIDDRRCPTCNKKLVNNYLCPKCSYSNNIDSENPVVFVSNRQDYSEPGSYRREEDFSIDNVSLQYEDLATYVLNQISTELDQTEHKIAVHILSSLNADGLLDIPLSEVARFHHVTLSTVEKILTLIKHSDPIGVGSSTPEEAIHEQLSVLSKYQDIDSLIFKAVDEGMTLMSRHQDKQLAKLLNTTLKRASEISEFIIKNLNPFPARAHWGSHRHQTNADPNTFTKPDVIISCTGQQEDPQLVVEIVWPLRGRLTISKIFDKALENAPKDKAEQWKIDLEKAKLLVKCLSQRNHTLVQLMRFLTRLQRDYILKGDSQLIPITRASIAEVLEVHESTISRAVMNKSVQLPTGKIIPISKFFDRSLPVRIALKEIVTDESNPLSDTKIAVLLEGKGFNIARRTVAKYRSVEGILPAHLRK